jgi:serine/threonine protein kinase
MTLRAGAKLGGYEIVTPLGAGGMGEVYRARDTQLNREVAIKVLPVPTAGAGAIRQPALRHLRLRRDSPRNGDGETRISEANLGRYDECDFERGASIHFSTCAEYAPGTRQGRSSLPGKEPATISDHKLEKVVDLKNFIPVGGFGTTLALTSDDSPLLLPNTGTQDVYALDWEEPSPQLRHPISVQYARAKMAIFSASSPVYTHLPRVPD